MTIKKLYKHLHKVLYSILEIGTKEISCSTVKQRIIYFNAILLALPIVYFLFVVTDIKSYLKPLNTWYFDQFGFFIFVIICLFCFYLNHLNKSYYSKILFILSWPLVLQIIPIIILSTPDDYYYAFPMGIIFHSILIQIVFCKNKTPWQFWTFLTANFILELNFLKILLHFDADGKSNFSELIKNDYYVLDVILYWLLFNLVINYLMGIIDSNSLKILNSMNIVKNQKEDLEIINEELKTSNDVLFEKNQIIQVQNAEINLAMQRLKEAQFHLIQAEKMASLGVLTAGVAHEINNPLNFIMGGYVGLDTYFKKTNQHPDEKIPILLNSIKTGIERASNIVNGLNQFSRNSKAYNEECNIHSIIDNCLLMINYELENRIEVRKNYLHEDIKIQGNVGKLHQVFINVFVNACHAIDNDGTISITTSKQKDEIIIEIADTGSGISLENLHRIADPFFTTKDPGKGTGLGLSITYNIIQDHKGKIEFKSDLNKGATVIITLPSKKYE